MNNVSTQLMRTSLGPWPEATEDFVNHQLLEDYITTLSRSNGVDSITRYNARVEELKKRGATWNVRISVLRKASTVGRPRMLSEDYVRSLQFGR